MNSRNYQERKTTSTMVNGWQRLRLIEKSNLESTIFCSFWGAFQTNGLNLRSWQWWLLLHTPIRTRQRLQWQKARNTVLTYTHTHTQRERGSTYNTSLYFHPFASPNWIYLVSFPIDQLRLYPSNWVVVSFIHCRITQVDPPRGNGSKWTSMKIKSESLRLRYTWNWNITAVWVIQCRWSWTLHKRCILFGLFVAIVSFGTVANGNCTLLDRVYRSIGFNLGGGVDVFSRIVVQDLHKASVGPRMRAEWFCKSILYPPWMLSLWLLSSSLSSSSIDCCMYTCSHLPDVVQSRRH